MKIRHSITKLFVLGSCLFVLAGSPVQAQEAAAPVRDPAQLHLASGSVMLLDLKTDKVLYARNPDRVAPIASVTKLMTAMVVLDARQPMDEIIPVTIRDNPDMKGVYSRVRVGSQVNRHDMLLMTLMSSENRAATALAHAYPGGYSAFIKAMNAKARALGMTRTRFAEPTGLSLHNVSSAHDLVLLLKESRMYPMLSQLSTTPEKTITFAKPRYSLGFRNTNNLVRKADWSIQVTKTGFTNKAGHCLVMLTQMNGRPVAMVLLDAFGKYTHVADATRMRRWLETGKSGPVPAAAKHYRQYKDSQIRQATVQNSTQ